MPTTIPLQRYEILLPRAFNDGTPIHPHEHDTAIHELVDRFGGMSADHGELKGYWQNKNYLYMDHHLRLILDIQPTEANRSWLQEFVSRWRDRLKQLSLYVVSYPVTVSS